MRQHVQEDAGLPGAVVRRPGDQRAHEGAFPVVHVAGGADQDVLDGPGVAFDGDQAYQASVDRVLLHSGDSRVYLHGNVVQHEHGLVELLAGDALHAPGVGDADDVDRLAVAGDGPVLHLAG